MKNSLKINAKLFPIGEKLAKVFRLAKVDWQIGKGFPKFP